MHPPKLTLGVDETKLSSSFSRETQTLVPSAVSTTMRRSKRTFSMMQQRKESCGRAKPTLLFLCLFAVGRRVMKIDFSSPNIYIPHSGRRSCVTSHAPPSLITIKNDTEVATRHSQHMNAMLYHTCSHKQEDLLRS